MKIKFKIYIGTDFIKNNNIKCKIISEEKYIPHGDILGNGEKNNDNAEYFSTIEKAATFISDYIDLLEKNDSISAIVYLNKFSNFKTFKNEKIVEILDLIQLNPNYSQIKSFDEIIDKD